MMQNSMDLNKNHVEQKISNMYKFPKCIEYTYHF
jgi:hypothetical protein